MWSLCKASLLLYILLGIVVGASAHANVLCLSENRAYPLTGYLEILTDSSARLTIVDILAPERNKHFKPIPGFLNLSFGNQAIWLRFRVQRSAAFPAESFLSLGPPMLDFITVHAQTGDDADTPDSYQVYRLGDHLPADESNRLQPDFVVPLNLPEGLIRWVYIRLKTTSTLSLLGSIKPRAILTHDSNISIIEQVAWLSVYLFVALISLIFCISLREALYGYFSLYLTALFVTRISSAGLLPLLVPDFAHYLNDWAISVGSSTVWIFLALLGFSLYGSVLTPMARLILRLLLMADCLLTLLLPFVPWGSISKINFSIGLLLLSVLGWLSFRQACRGVRGGWLYCASFNLLLIGGIIHFIFLIGFIPVAPWKLNIIQYTTVGHLLILTLALAEKLRLDQKHALLAERNAKRHAQEMAYQMTAELSQKTQDLEQTLKRQVRFVAMVSHEYRTPLAIIRTNLDLLSKKKHDPNGTLAFAVNKMKRAVSRLVEVLEINLDKARFATDDFKLRLEDVYLPALVGEAITQAKEFWPERQLDYYPGVSPEIVISADRRLLKTALLNLLDNAVKYSPMESVVEVNLHCRGNQAIIGVTDHGCGIPLSEYARVFEKHYRITGNTAFSISVRYLHICAPCRQRVADLLRIKDCRAATLCRQLFQNLINVIN